MRIALRTSGGRGEYELAGRQGNVLASDLFDKELFYELTPSIVIPGRATATRVQGKPRIRLSDRQTTTHFYRLLAGVLLLPKPKREFKETHGVELIRREAYSMTAIKVDVGKVQQSRVVLRPTDVLLENADRVQDKLRFARRMSRITRLWEAAATKDSSLAELIKKHMAAVVDATANHKAVEEATDAIARNLNTTDDVLPLAERELGIADLPAQGDTAWEQVSAEALEQEFAEDDATSPEEARMERVKQWRQVAVRGSAGIRFRTSVTERYDFRCLFTGQRLPKTEATDSPGVDAAHILPWSTHNLNSNTNWLCLSKLCHWAFDAGVVKLRFDTTANEYLIEIPQHVRSAASKANFDLHYFESIAGSIPRSRLPSNSSFWPSPTCLDELNSFTYANIE
jgi:hypothetical protein